MLAGNTAHKGIEVAKELNTTLKKLTSVLEETNRLERRRQREHAHPKTIINNLNRNPHEQIQPCAELHHDEKTMDKVYEVLREIGYLPEDIPGAISAFQNAGILFRERS